MAIFLPVIWNFIYSLKEGSSYELHVSLYIYIVIRNEHNKNIEWFSMTFFPNFCCFFCQYAKVMNTATALVKTDTEKCLCGACLCAVKRNQNKSHSTNRTITELNRSVAKNKRMCRAFSSWCFVYRCFYIYFCFAKQNAFVLILFSPIFHVICSFRLSWVCMVVTVNKYKRLACWSVTCEILTAIITALCHHATIHIHTHTHIQFSIA